MLKKPTTRKLSEKKVLAAEDKDHNKFKKLFPDEQFYQFPGYPNVYCSQYANVITTYGRKSYWRSLYYDPNTGYTSIVLCKHGKRRMFYIHEIVAEIWLEKPSFELQDILNIHHKIKVKQYLQCQPININFAENLQYVYLKYHPMLDSIKSIKYLFKSKWHKAVEPEEIAIAYNVSAYTIYELLYHEPQDIKSKYEYYIKDNITIKVMKDKPCANGCPRSKK